MTPPSNRVANQSAVKLALLAKQAHAQVEDILAAEPIAVIGLGCRFPGGGDTPEAFWRALLAKTDASGEVPPDRFDVEAYYDPDSAAPGKMNSRKASFLPRVDEFDAAFFGIPGREATTMDPQQRLLLEVAYEALEDAGLPHATLSGTQTGVFIASYHSDYSRLQYADLESIDVRTLTGTLHAVVANRLSFLLNLHGPSLAVDTACSSSLVAVHLACQSLRNREADMALAGGVSLIITPEMNVALSKVGFIAPDGSCKTFDASADGFARGEGCGVIVLKRLADALADGDRLVAVIRGSAVNQDGRSSILTAPNGLAQQAVVRQALANAGLTPDQIGLVEAHGTGTLLGDPIETEALAEVFGPRRSPDQVCYLTSVKTNVGHLEAAAGMAGIIKTILCLKNEAIPAQAKFTHLNPHIRLEGTPFVIPAENIPWPASAQARFAGTSGFGVGGTNAHVILSEAPVMPPAASQPGASPSGMASSASSEGRPFLLPFSARTPEALASLAGRFAAFLAHTDESLTDVCFTASVRRTHFEQRAAVVGTTKEELVRRLEAFRAGSAEEASGLAPRVAFVFSGQGPQWWGMGRELLASEAVFRQTVEHIDALLRPLAGWSLLEQFTCPEAESRLAQTAVAQPAIFALQMGLDALWRSWGLLPEAVVGHSVGEIAAAVSAGALAIEDAVMLVHQRAGLMQQADGNGKMASVDLPAAELEALIAPYGSRLSVAAINGPAATVLSGESAALEEACETLKGRGVGVHPLRVNYAFHSTQMAPFAEELTSRLAGLKPHAAAIPMISTLTGQALFGPELVADYWGRNIRQPVRFAAAIEKLAAEGFTLFLELSPHPALCPMVAQTLEAGSWPGSAIPSLRRQQPEGATLLAALGELYRLGADIPWEKRYPQGGRVVSLPLYPWQRQRYWFEPSGRPHPQHAARQAGHPLLGLPTRSPAVSGVLFQNEIRSTSPAYLADHRILGQAVFPAAASLEMALSASAQVFEGAPLALEDVSLPAALVLAAGESHLVQLHLVPEGDTAAFKIYSEPLAGGHPAPGADHWLLHASGTVHCRSAAPAAALSLAEVRARCPHSLAPEAYYATLLRRGTAFGPAFQGLREIRYGQEETLAEVSLPAALLPQVSAYHLHPALLDALLQPVAVLLPATWAENDTYVPIGVESLNLYRQPPAHLWSHLRLRAAGSNGTALVADLTACDGDGQVVLEIRGLSLQRTTAAALQRSLNKTNEVSNWLLEVAWEPQELAATTGPISTAPWAILAEEEDAPLGIALAAALQARGASSTLAHPATFAGVLKAAPLAGMVYLAHPSPLPSSLTFLHSLVSAAPAEPFALWLVTSGAQAVEGTCSNPEQAALWGLGKTIQLEYPGLHCRLVDLDPLALPAEAAAALAAELLAREGQAAETDEDQLACRGTRRFVPRLKAVRRAPTSEPRRLNLPQRGLLDHLQWTAFPPRAPGTGEIQIRVSASGLNFRDVLKALDRYPGDDGELGDECAGEVSAVGAGVTAFQRGDRVVALAAGSHASIVTVDARLAAPLPAGLGFAEAASLPIAYLTAYYALHTLGHLAAGENVLIHAAAGGVGLAAVRLAQRAGATIFATAGSPEKREFLRAQGVAHVFDSRSLAFSDEIRALTGGKGVEVALNSLAGDFIPATFRCLAAEGRFLEIGKTGVWTPEQVRQARPQAAYHLIYLGDLFQNDPAQAGRLLREVLDRCASLAPLPYRIFPISQASEAFRFMAQARHIGKIVLAQPALSHGLSAANPAALRPEATYLLTGGFGGIGRHVARWMAAHGARHLVLTSREGAVTPAAQQLLDELAGDGVQVTVFPGDIADPAVVARLFEQIGAHGFPLRGIFHAAGVNDDGVLAQQTPERFARVFAPKLEAARHLFRHGAHLPLDFFVLFSSVAATFGSAGQGNYAAANAALDGLASHLRAQGFPAQALAWGIWDGIGMAGRLAEHDRQRYASQGWGLITPEAGMQALELALQQPQPNLVLFPADWPAFLRHNAGRPFFSGMKAGARASAVSAAGQSAPTSTRPAFLHRWAETPSTLRRGLLLGFLGEEAVRAIGLAPGTRVNPRTALRELGLDSLMAVELRNALGRALGASLSATLLFDYPTCEALADFLVKKVPALGEAAPHETPPAETPSATAPAPETPPPPAAEAAIADLSEEDAEALLLAELDALKKAK